MNKGTLMEIGSITLKNENKVITLLSRVLKEGEVEYYRNLGCSEKDYSDCVDLLGNFNRIKSFSCRGCPKWEAPKLQ